MIKFFLLCAALVGVARADLSQSTTLSDGTNLNLDTGQTGGLRTAQVFDIQWSGGTMVAGGKAKLVNVGTRTAAQFDQLTESDIKNRTTASASASIPAANLVANDVFYVLTNSGNASKVFVNRVVTGSLIINFVTYQSAAPGAPKVTAVLNNSSLIAEGLPNSGIAPSSLFIVRGTGMADAGAPVLQSSAAPGLPLTLNGASIAVTVGGVTTHPAIYYTSPTQIAAVLPANTPVGSGNVTVTYNGLTSAPYPVTVLRSAPGLNYYGTNTDVATDAVSGAVLGFTNSGAPGQTVVMWATGLGANPADSDTTFSTTPHAVNVNLQVFIGGVAAKILYQGSAGYPGVNQINLVIPESAPEGCWVAVAAVVDTTVSNIATLPIRKGGGECIDPVSGFKGSQLSPGGTATFRAGFVSLFQSNTPDRNNNRTIEYGSTADFSRYSGVSYDPANSLSPGGCIIRQNQPVIPGVTGLNAGTITLAGPGGLNVALKSVLVAGAYSATLTDIPSTGGVYTWTSTGATVGPFTATVNLNPPLFSWTNPSAATTINRSSGLKVTWSGGNPGSYVSITGSSVLTGGGVIATGTYSCLEHVEAGQFTVPSYILNALPAGQSGSTVVSNLIYFPLSASGLDFATGLASIGYTVTNATSGPTK